MKGSFGDCFEGQRKKRLEKDTTHINEISDREFKILFWSIVIGIFVFLGIGFLLGRFL